MTASKARRIFKKAYQVIRPRTTHLLLDIAIYCAPVYLLTWYFDLLEGLSLRIFMSLLVAMAPVSELLTEPRPFRSRGDLFWFALFIGLMSLLATGDRFNVNALTTSPAVLISVLPWGWLVWQLLGRNWMLLTGLLLALAVMMIYWTAAVVMTDESWIILLLPVPLVMFFGVFWALPARLVLGYARRSKHHRMRGPGMQVLAMAMLFFPLIVVAVAIPGMLQLSPIWSAVSLTIAGVLLGAVISEPLRRFLLEWGNLSPEQ